MLYRSFASRHRTSARGLHALVDKAPPLAAAQSRGAARLANALRGVAVHQRAGRVRGRGSLSNRLYRAGLIVGVHQRHYGCLSRAQRHCRQLQRSRSLPRPQAPGCSSAGPARWARASLPRL